MHEFDHGLVLGKFYPFHAGHSHLVCVAQAACREVTVEVLGSSAESVSLRERVAWILDEHPTARVVSGLDDAPVDFDSHDAWDAHMRPIRDLLHRPVDAVFTSDPYGDELARRLDARWIRVDATRADLPVSGTAIRADLGAMWWALTPAVRSSLVRRVVTLGAESTGSTTLASDLAVALGTSSVPEYGREHSRDRDGALDAPWRTDEFDLIMDRQAALEDRAARTCPTPILVCDTDALATVHWHERYVGAAPARLVRRALAHPPALYLLTGDEIPFVQDGLRDGEHLRHDMQNRFHRSLAEQPVPWIEVRGTREQRVQLALEAIRDTIPTGAGFAAPLPQRGTGTDIR